MKYSHRMLWLKMNEFHYNWTDMNKCEITILNVNLFTRAEHIGWWAFIDRNVTKLFVLVEWKKSYFNLSVPFELDRFECLQIQISLVNIWLLKFTVELLIVVWAYLSLLISSILDKRAKRSNKSNHLNNVFHASAMIIRRKIMFLWKYTTVRTMRWESSPNNVEDVFDT